MCALTITLYCSALALACFNICRAVWSYGPDGVGQSLLNHIIANMFGKLHQLIDTGIYLHGGEMRKSAGTLVRKLVVTAQEAVEGCGHAVREDLYKKHNMFLIL